MAILILELSKLKMKLLSVALLVGQASAFTPQLQVVRQTNLFSNVLEGKEIQSDFTPVNNMVLVKKVEVVDKTEGGIFLTGKVRFNSCLLDRAEE